MPTTPLPGPRRAIVKATPAQLARLTTAAAMQAMAEAAALTYRRDASPAVRDLLDAPEVEE